MLTLTRPRRQVLATLGILALSVVPTVLVGVWAWGVRQPGHVREVERALSASLGLDVAIEAVDHPRPGVDVLRGVVLREEEPGTRFTRLAEVARADRVRLTRDGDRLAIELDGPRLVLGGAAGGVVEAEALLKRLSAMAPRVEIVAGRGRVAFGRAEGPIEFGLRDLAALVRSADGQAELSASYRLELEESSPRCELQVARSGRAEAPRLALHFRTADGTVPAGVLSPFVDAAAWLGDAATLEGRLSLLRDGGAEAAWRAEFEGTLGAVDLSRLVESRFPGRVLRGVGTIEVERAEWGILPGNQGDGWRSATGRLAAGRGAIGVELLKALDAELGVDVTPIPAHAGPGDALAFDRLGLTFRLAEDGQLALGGGLGTDDAPGALAVGGPRAIPIASAPAATATVLGLWKALVTAPGDVLVPIAPEAHVFRHLPMPGERPASARGN